MWTLLQDAQPTRVISLPQRGYECRTRKFARLMLQDQASQSSQFVDGSQWSERSRVEAAEASLNECTGCSWLWDQQALSGLHVNLVRRQYVSA